MECLVVGRITRSPPKPKPKYLHEVTLGRGEADQAWIWEEAARIASFAGYKKRPRSWASTIVAFDTLEKAAALKRRLDRWRHEQERAKDRLLPCAVNARYREAALRQHAVIWGLSTGHIRPIVQAYRRGRLECSSHGAPNWAATEVLAGICPGIDFERGRRMVDAMLVYIEARHRDWFWKGLQGNESVGGFLRF